MKKKILLVEDEVLLAMAEQQELSGYNYETVHVTTGEEAVDLFCNQNESIDLILMDIDLGSGIDGTESARRILECREIPIVFLSSHEGPEVVEKTEKISSYGYVVKSSSITVLDASIKMAFKLFDTKKDLTIHQKTLEKNEKDLKASQHIARLGSWRLDVATNAVTWTEELYKMYGFDPSLPPPPYNKQEEIFTPESWERLSAALSETVKTGKPYMLELEMARESKSIGWMWVKGEAIQDEAGKTVELWGAAQDITEKKQMEKALIWSEELLNKTGELARVGGWEADLTTNKVFWTQVTKLIHEVPLDYKPMLEEALSFFPGDSGERLTMAFNRAVEEGGGYDLELDFITAKGNKLKVRAIGNTEHNNGRCERIYGTFQDITKQKKAEEELLRALQEKDYLMKELNHRVKNNLLMVSSLIDLKNSETEADLSDIHYQIKAISLIHEKLYQTGNTTEVDCRNYFDDLLSSIFSSFSSQPVRIEENIDDISIPAKQVLPLGLIINEIATNAIKHGFNDKEEAIFSIKMVKDHKKNGYELTLSNTGNSFPEDIEPEDTETLGLRLITVLVAQIDGKLDLKRRPFPVFTITFQLEE